MPTTPDILDKILQTKAEEVKERSARCSIEELQEKIAQAPALRPFHGAIRENISAGQPAVIAEIKKASPSKGLIRKDFDPAKIARAYEKGGACCLSVVTDVDFFQGADEYLQSAREACQLPVIRKDFVIDPYQVYESRALGADCILLIAAVLKDREMRELSDLAESLGLDVLVEIHNREELERAHVLRCPVIGINNRDLHSFETTLQTTLRLMIDVFPDRTVITESGINSHEDVLLMRKNGVNGFLVGESLMRADDPGEKLRELFF